MYKRQVFTRADWAPEALVVVGSAGDFERILHRLEDALSVPVFAPEEAKLALARGAALASAQSTEMPLDVFDDGFVVDARHDSRRQRSAAQRKQHRRTLSRVGPVAMLAVGAVTFVVSVSIAVSLQLSPTRATEPSNPVPAAKVEKPEAVRAVPPAMPPPVAIPPAPVVEAALPPPPPEALPPVYDEPPVAVVDAPAETPYVDQAPAAAPDYPAPVAAVPVDPALAPPVVGGPMMPDDTLSTIPTKKPGIWTRIKEKLTPGPG